MKHIVIAIFMALLFSAAAFAEQTPAPEPTPAPEAEPTPTPEPTPEQVQPETAEEYFIVAVNYFRAGDLSGSERYVRTAIALESRYAEARYLLGQVLLYRAAQMNRLLIENPGLGSALLPSQTQWEQGIPELQEAVSQFRIVIKLQPDNTSAWLLLATCLDNMGQEEDAINAYK